MPSSNSAVKTYTQPSCTLQIVTYDSPSPSRRGRSIDKQLQFELSFDDPQLLNEKQVSIQGDRQQLTALQEVVNTHIQGLLASSPEQFNISLAAQTTQLPQVLGPSASQMSDSVTSDASRVAFGDDITAASEQKISLQSGSGIAHNLFLGSLATNETGRVIHLSLLQLFDLATVLDEYATDALTTPTSIHSRRAVSNPSNTWAGIAAMLLVSVGLTTAVVQLLNRSEEQQQTANRTSPNSSTNDPSLALKPSPTPQLSTPETLPSLPPVAANNPTPTTNPSPGIIPSPSTTLPGSPLPVPQITPGIPSPPPAITKTTPISPLPGIASAPPISSNPLPKQTEGTITIGGQTASKSNSDPLASITPTANIPSPLPQPSPKSKNTDESSPAGLPTQLTSQQRLEAALQRRSPGTSNPNNAPQTTALATTPQLTEIKNYFQKRWEPPTGLTQTLEYSIILDVDGTIQRIEPLGQAARIYVDRSGLPLIGENFVSPNPNGETPRIRVVLSPNGRVQTFLEQEQNRAARNNS